MKSSTQLKALIRNLSRDKGVNAEILLRNFMLERLLERISLSKYKNQFILKGGMLIAAIVGIDARSTMDMDATIKGLTLTEEKLEEVFNEILFVPVDDGVQMSLSKLENIRDESEYPGIRVSIESIFDKTRQTMKVDITAGDKITPRAIEYKFQLLLEDRTISVLAYNLETVFAEKLETILSRGTTTTRMRDYYDIYILMELHESELDDDLLTEAFIETSKHRGSLDNIKNNSFEYIKMIESSEILLNLWERYRSKNEYASDISWIDALNSMEKAFNKIHLS
ncbi:MAG: nucleotidyl transferase AbiEii/AbiGii toxin family protein [Tepidanaerobacteraceae bacterium]|nr:nucleotidyl transferase AbiEii/AbiGii toxin family protein [Tepidanaerobacteraceae bacterium]